LIFKTNGLITFGILFKFAECFLKGTCIIMFIHSTRIAFFLAIDYSYMTYLGNIDVLLDYKQNDIVTNNN